MSLFHWLKMAIHGPFIRLVHWYATRHTRAFLWAKSSMLTSRWVVDRSVCIGKYCGDNKYYIQGTPGKTIATRCPRTASQETTTRTNAICWCKHWWCRALRYTWGFPTWMFSSKRGFSRFIFFWIWGGLMILNWLVCKKQEMKHITKCSWRDLPIWSCIWCAEYIPWNHKKTKTILQEWELVE